MTLEKKFLKDVGKYMDTLSFDPYMLGLTMGANKQPDYIYERMLETFVCMMNSWAMNFRSPLNDYPDNVGELSNFLMTAVQQWVYEGKHVYGILTGMHNHQIYRMGGNDAYR